MILKPEIVKFLKKNLLISELSRMSGVDRQTLYHAFNNEKTVYRKTAIKIAKGLDELLPEEMTEVRFMDYFIY